MKKFWATFFFTLIIVLLIAGCGVQAVPMAFINRSVRDWVLITPNPNAQPTATPFQPQAKQVENTPVAEIENSADENPTETETALIGLDIPEGQINFLLLGSDYRPDSGFRTDVIMLVGINTISNKVSVVSFPRDLCVYIPGTYSGYDVESCDRINTAMQFGFGTTQDMFEANFGVRPDYYALINMQGFTALVENLGGVEVEIAQTLSDKCSLPQASNGYCTVYPGTMLMNGETALWYVRSRYSTSDYDRLRRAQEVIQALFNRMISLDVLAKIPSMYDIYADYVETNIPLDIVLGLAKVASVLDMNTIYRETLEPPEVIDTRQSNGAYVSLPNHYYIDPIIQQAFFTE
ncbi:MAG: LCP family protein [Anaerolineae bacterium]|nr:LCP family protein [Anaerolineae bacterium]